MDRPARRPAPTIAVAVAVRLAAILALTAATPAGAATITVGPGCDLISAISSANALADTGSCTHDGIYGEGDEIIVLPFGAYGFDTPHSSNTALPTIIRSMTIVGNGSTISRTNGTSAPFFRLLRVTAGHLRLLNLTLTGGLEKSDGEGGAIRVGPTGSLTLATVDLTGNGTERIVANVGGIARGGAVFFASSGALSLGDVTLSNNTANAAANSGGGLAEGGALYVAGTEGAGAGPVALTDVTVQNNSALASGSIGPAGTARGGGIYVRKGDGIATVIRGLLRNNRAEANRNGGNGGTSEGGALYLVGAIESAGVDMARLYVWENIARALGSPPGNGGSVSGAGVFIQAFASRIGVWDTTFRQNFANANAFTGRNGGTATGGGLAIVAQGDGTTTITRSAFYGQLAAASAGTCENSLPPCDGAAIGGTGRGGAISFAGGSANLALTATTVAGNAASCSSTPGTGGAGGDGKGGGIAFAGNALALTNVTLTSNTATALGTPHGTADGGGIMVGSSATIENSVVAANLPVNCGKAADTITSLGSNIFDALGGCGVAGPGDQVGVDVGLAALVDDGQAGHAHRLPQPGSAALDAASPGACPVIDQLGHPRDGACDIGAAERIDAIPQVTLLAAVLPASRSGLAGAVLTAFVTVINTSATTPAHQVGIALQSAVPALLRYQTTDAANALVGIPDTPADIPPGGAQSFVIFLLATSAFPSTDLILAFTGTNTAPVTTFVGLNTFLASASVTAIPDVVALAATIGNNGIVDVVNGAGAFSVATINLGAPGPITVSAGAGAAALGLAIFVCRTDSSTGICLAPPTTEATVDIATNATPTFAVFVNAGSSVTFDPAANRVLVFFKDAGGVVRGGTSVAVRTL